MLRFEDVFNHKKLLNASKRVKKKKGACGVDGMSAYEAYKFFKKKYKREIIIKRLRHGDYKAHTNRNVSIPKENGKRRRLSINSVVDRVILDCLSEGLNRKFGHLVSGNVHGFVKGKGCLTALLSLRLRISEGYVYGVKLDLKSYFDKIPHKRLYQLLEEMVDDKLKWVIKTFVIASNNKGLPQGNPISPFLANLYLQAFDKWLDSLNEITYIRYADDILLLSKVPISANLVKEVEKRLKNIGVTLNSDKTEQGKVFGMKFLGVVIEKDGYSLPKKREVTFREKVNRLFKEEDNKALDQYLCGWIGYYGIADVNPLIKTLDDSLIQLWGNDVCRSYHQHLLQIQSKFEFAKTYERREADDSQ